MRPRQGFCTGQAFTDQLPARRLSLRYHRGARRLLSAPTPFFLLLSTGDQHSPQAQETQRWSRRGWKTDLGANRSQTGLQPGTNTPHVPPRRTCDREVV